ncbi:hypothetical protein LEP1GSC083_1040 [Leptospira interrogans serovar Pyrogenes str. L0374]|uniref:Uncharacterized protein n=1 Tax=Leptospira interrogans serovar Pyrogenes str. L0374 TaxID=1049928 RepID=M6K5H6_LEPIR|nr:hypothetical protein [Leptospira borgpetersenii]EMN29386.1 hypothetical protein LEP1GSC083_1040 [Leptospira interrogans serovar Pyrogenes str. L0374]
MIRDFYFKSDQVLILLVLKKGHGIFNYNLIFLRHAYITKLKYNYKSKKW